MLDLLASSLCLLARLGFDFGDRNDDSAGAEQASEHADSLRRFSRFTPVSSRVSMVIKMPFKRFAYNSRIRNDQYMISSKADVANQLCW